VVFLDFQSNKLKGFLGTQMIVYKTLDQLQEQEKHVLSNWLPEKWLPAITGEL